MEWLMELQANLLANLLQLIKTIGVGDIIDILIVAYLVYKIITIIRETRAEQLLKGVGILLVVMQLSQWLKLNSVAFLLRNFVQVGLIAIIIMFQPELRKMLEQVGRSKFSNFMYFDENNTIDDINKLTEEIGNAVDVLSKTRTGALIVFEKNTKIGEIIRTGVKLQADVSSELLLNLFAPNTPLHDGAVIIKDNKIQAAGCFLPLTQNHEHLSTELGTRHRAALGISEDSDCVVVVVSEETGRISFAKNGDLTRNLTVENLKKALHKSLTSQSENKEQSNRILGKWVKKK